MSVRSTYAQDPRLRVINGVCPHDCPDSCAWQVAVERNSGRAIDIWGHPDHPVTRGNLCGKVDHYLERTYHPDRVTTPLRRVGPKGSGRFEVVGWEEAIPAIAAQLQRHVAEDGEEAVLPYSYFGTMGILQSEGMAERFFNRLGATRLARTICADAGMLGYSYTVGRTIGLETEDYAHARLIVLWGTNTLTSNLHLWPFVLEARKAGARIVVVDPVRTRTARAADTWIPIRPGTDGALALGLMHVVLAEGLEDREYVELATVGIEELRGRAAEHPPERVERLTGVPAATIRELAREYATTRPAAIRINYGLQRHRGGGMAVRNIACLPALVGAWRERGGGIQLSTSGSAVFERKELWRPELLRGRRPRTFNMNRLGDALSLDPAIRARAYHHPRPVDRPPRRPLTGGPPIRALLVYNSNPAVVAPDQAAVLRGLAREDLLTVVLEHFRTDTADWADWVLPATTQLEHWDLVKAYGHLYLALNRPAIAPVGEALPNSEIFRRLARAMGFDEPCFAESDEEILRAFLTAQTDPAFAGLTWERLLEEGFARFELPSPYLPFARGGFPTASGRCELRSTALERDGYDPLPTFVEEATPAQEGELHVISPPAHSFLNSTFANLERFVRREKGPRVLLHPEDAGARGIVDGAAVRVSNALGSVVVQAVVTPDVVRGTAVAPSVWWNKLGGDGRSINQLTPQDEADMGSGALFYDVRARVEPVIE